MVSRCPAVRATLILSYALISMVAKAQPTLPDMSCAAAKGRVMLSWNCQYDGIKEITVMRSNDSVSNYTKTGTVKKLGRGMQEFADEHPLPGRNYYKLMIVFGSGLKWRSHFCSALVEKTLREASGDTLQWVIVTKSQQNTGNEKATPDHKIKMTPSYDDISRSPATFINPVHISVDGLSGNVNITVPDDGTKHHYSIKFFDLQNQVVTEIPRLTAPKIIMDKRNFQGKGIYKFVMRKDGLELETGYITIN